MTKLVLLIAVLMSFTLAHAATPSSAKRLPNHQVSLAAKEAGVRDLIKNLLDQTDLKYQLPPSMTNTKKISLMVKNANWSEVFMNTLVDAGFTYTFNSAGVLVITPAKN